MRGRTACFLDRIRIGTPHDRRSSRPLGLAPVGIAPLTLALTLTLTLTLVKGAFKLRSGRKSSRSSHTLQRDGCSRSRWKTNTKESTHAESIPNPCRRLQRHLRTRPLTTEAPNCAHSSCGTRPRNANAGRTTGIFLTWTRKKCT